MCRDPNTIPDPNNPVVLSVTGDSVTSAHHQFGFGAMCANTSFDNRGLVGDNGIFSYAGRYTNNLNPNVSEYYNFARTGFTTRDMLTAGPGTPDACGNPWARGVAPVAQAAAVTRQAKADGKKAYYATTGGINNTNWTTVLQQLIKCRGLEFAAQTWANMSTFTWGAIGGRNGIITNGGGCVWRIRNPNPFSPDWFIREGVPRYDGPAQYPVITADVTTIVQTLLNAGADKIVWMLYYDINPANIDIGNFAWYYIRAYSPGWVVGLMPPTVTPVLQPLVDPAWVGAVRAVTTALNNAILAGIPANPKVMAQTPPIFFGGDIQTTALGGCPHPSASGHDKLAARLDAAFKALP